MFTAPIHFFCLLFFRHHSEVSSRGSPPEVLPPPSPRLIKRPSTSPMPSRSGSTTPISLRKKAVLPTEYQDTVPAEFEEKIREPKPLSHSNTQDSRPHTPLSEYSRKEYTPRPSPKLTRASSKVFEKVRGLEERRRSLDLPEGSVTGRSWAGFNRAGSVDSDDGGSRLGISRESSREDLREALKEDAAERRSMFRQRAASLEDKPRYSQKVQDIENKFTEELQRIKKLVGKPHMKKSFSTEQLSQRSRQRQPLRKIEPIPPQVLQKLQERERAQLAREQRERELSKQPMQRQQQTATEQNKSSPQQNQSPASTPAAASSTPESMKLSDLPGQRSLRELSRVSPVTEVIQRSASPALLYQRTEESAGRNVAEMTLQKVERRPPSPLVQRISRVAEDTPGRKTPVEVSLRTIEHRPESPLVKRRAVLVPDASAEPPAKPRRLWPSAPTEEKMEVERSKPAASLMIPAIVVEDEKMEEDLPVKTSQSKQTSVGAKEGQQQKSKGKKRRTRPLSPELGSICFFSSSSAFLKTTF